MVNILSKIYGVTLQTFPDHKFKSDGKFLDIGQISHHPAHDQLLFHSSYGDRISIGQSQKFKCKLF